MPQQEGASMADGTTASSIDAVSRVERFADALQSRRAALTFAAIVFLTTLGQSLANPLTFIAQDPEAWTSAVPLAAVLLAIVAATALQSASLLLSARWPELAVCCVLAAYLALLVLTSAPGWLPSMQLVVAVALFLLAARRSTLVVFAWWAVTVVVCVGVLWAWVSTIETEPHRIMSFLAAQTIGFAGPTAGATALGVWWGVQSRRMAQARADAEAARREHEARVAQARAHERARIAQELHDVAGQHLSGLITLAEAAVAVGPQRAETMLQLVEDVRAEGHFAAASLYGALAELKAVEGEHTENTRDLRRSDELIDYWRRHGMAIEAHVHGELSELPVVVSTTAYRGIQEALTNASKHAAGSPVDVAVEADDAHLRVTVENGKGSARHADHDRPGLGWGLSGLRDRVRLVDGTLDASPTDEGGWRVEMRFPLSSSEVVSKARR